MNRAKFQVLIIPFRICKDGIPEFAITKRSDMDVWQFVAGGGEDGETQMQAAKREANEEASIPYACELIRLDSISSIPANNFVAHVEWGKDVYVVPEYSFAVDMTNKELKLSFEHTELRWLKYKEAVKLLKWDSNKTALWELKERIIAALHLTAIPLRSIAAGERLRSLREGERWSLLPSKHTRSWLRPTQHR
jgi:dATP pyrophosphohydrolase